MGLKRSRLVLPKDEYEELKREVLRRDRHKCRCCKTRNNLNVHHIIYRSQQGDDASWNLITLCSGPNGDGPLRCHEAVHAGKLLILAGSGNIDDPVDANKPVRFHRPQGWNTR